MTFEAILYIAVLVLAAKLFGELMHRINQPTILGNVLAGIVVGPALFAWVSPIDEINLFIEIGVFFLFFLIGLEEIDLPGLFKVLRKRIFAGSAIGFMIPFVVSGVFGMAIDLDFVQAFAIASVIGASSLGVTAKILTDLGKLKSTIGLEIFTITAIVEFIAIIVASVMVQIDTSEQLPEFSEFVWLFAKIIIFFAVAGLLAVFVLPHFFRFIKRHLKVQQIYFGIVIGIILLVAYFAELSGIHGAIGALLLGIAVSRMTREEYREISKNVHVIGHGIFIPIFFAGIGIHFSPNFFELPILIIGGFLAIIIGGKFVASYLAVRFAHMRPARVVAYGVMSKGAVDLALMLTLLEAEILEEKLFSLLVFGTLIMMVLSSVELQRNLKKYVQVKIGKSELGLMPIYFRRAVSDLTAHHAMILDYPKVDIDVSVEDFVKEYGTKFDSEFLVFKDVKLVGLLSKRELKRIHKNQYPEVKIGKIMNQKFFSTSPDDYMFSVIQKMNSHPFEIIPVIDTLNDKVVGVVTTQNIIELLAKEDKKTIK